jgi:hypothetical protein
MKLSNDVTYGWHAINENLFFSLNKKLKNQILNLTMVLNFINNTTS